MALGENEAVSTGVGDVEPWALERSGLLRRRATGLQNRHPLRCWAQLAPLPGTRTVVPGALRRSGLRRLAVTFPAGYIAAAGDEE
ncbi:MAG: hypothetical protein M3066_17230 [Actinomycetota bacterium]|nr:hypothetical protein [Actinomycetota bacterium]